MKRRPPAAIEVFSLSAIDIFASAMGAFVIISIILMPDYQKEVKADGDLTHLEQMVEDIAENLTEAEAEEDKLKKAVAAARAQLSEIESHEQELLRALAKAPQPVISKAPEEEPENVSTKSKKQVTFRMLGMKTTKSKLLVIFDMNGRFAKNPEAKKLIEKTVVRIVDSLQEYHEFALLGYQYVGGREKYHRWPSESGFEVASEEAKDRATKWTRSAVTRVAGGNPLLGATERGIRSGAEAILLVTDGLAGPSANRGIANLRQIASQVRQTNRREGPIEINTVIVGDFFRYKAVVVETMEAIAKESGGSFMALLP
jgi:hypothetical protein